MDIVSACPLRVASLMWQPRPGAFALTVVCKATYALAPVLSPLAPAQDEPFHYDGYRVDEATSSLERASDLAPFKRHVDVLLVGSAYAPSGRPATSVTARLVAAGI